MFNEEVHVSSVIIVRLAKAGALMKGCHAETKLVCPSGVGGSLKKRFTVVETRSASR